MSVSPIVVLCEQRTGSNLLCNLINQYPGVSRITEWLNTDQHPHLLGTDEAGRVEWLHDQVMTPGGGAKVMFEHLEALSLGLSTVFDTLAPARVVVLFRRVLLEQYASKLRAERTGAWVAPADGGDPDPQPIDIEYGPFHAFCLASRARYDAALGMLRDRDVPHALVSYEELRYRRSAVIGRVLEDFLGLGGHRPVSQLRKQNPEPILDRVTDPHKALAVQYASWALHYYPTEIEASDLSADSPQPPERNARCS